MNAAQEYLEQGLDITRRVGDKRDEAAVLTTLGDVYRDIGLWEQAVKILEQALPLAQQSGVAKRKVEAHWFLGAAYQKSGKTAQAKYHLDQAEQFCLKKGFRKFLPRIYLDWACLHLSEMDHIQAQAYLVRARKEVGKGQDEEFFGLMNCAYGDLFQQKQEWEAAIRCYQEAIELFDRIGMPTKAASAHLGLGSSYLERRKGGDRTHAREHLQTAQEEYQRIGAQFYIKQVASNLERLEEDTAY
jgi:tetratricopeptide (TPR) repeat protein